MFTTILFILLILVILFLVAAAMSSDEYVIERSIVINKPKQQVFDFIKLLKNQERYNKWVMMDPQCKRDYRGTDGTVGALVAWESQNKQVGKGEQEIVKLIDGQEVDTEVRFEKPFAGKGMARFSTESQPDGGTKVNWVFSGKRNFAMKIFHLLFNLKKALGKDLETGLVNLKQVVE